MFDVYREKLYWIDLLTIRNKSHNSIRELNVFILYLIFSHQNSNKYRKLNENY
jgi:hypothetical protein